MNRYLSILLLGTISLTTIHTSVAQQQDIISYHHCDFTDGIPSDYTTYDRDGQTLHYTMVQAGIKQGEAWTRKKESGKDNYYAMSACRYKEIEGETLRPSDDWLITPRLWIRGENAQLSWRGISIKNLLTVGAGYEVLISTTGNTPEDFTTPLFSIAEETIGEWTQHSVDLSQYQGQHIYIAFHNNSQQGEILGIDDISIDGHRGVCDMQVTTGSHIFATNKLTISTAITSYNDTPITHMTLYYRHGENLVTETLDNLNINKYETFQYTFPTAIDVQYGDTIHYSVGASVQDIPQDPIDCTTVAFAFKTTRKSVIEEATGMWCTYCPQGIVAMETIEHKYPEQFIGLALHSGDPLADGAYANELGFPEGYPTAWVNRSQYVVDLMIPIEIDGRETFVADNGGLESVFLDEQQYMVPLDIAITHVDTYNNDITIDIAARPAIDIENAHFNIAFVIVENNVWQEGYYQSNSYSGREPYLQGWYERPNPVIEDYTFNHVVRSIYDSYQGIEGILPATLSVGDEYTSSHTFQLPGTILNTDNVKVVAMIINRDNGAIVNACESSTLAAIKGNTIGNNNHCYTTGKDLHIVQSQGSQAHINIFNTTGHLVASLHTQQAHITMSMEQPGLYIVAITRNNCTSTHKVIIR